MSNWQTLFVGPGSTTVTVVLRDRSNDGEPERPRYLVKEAFRGCCGAGVICGFPEPQAKYDYRYNPRKLIEEGKISPEIVSRCREDLKIWLRDPNSLQLLILTDKQKPFYEDMISEFGFKPLIKDKYHHYAGNLLTLYCRTRYKKKKDGDWADTKLDGTVPGSWEEYED